MTPLSTRAEQAAPEETRGLLEELYDNCLYAWKGANALATFDARLDCEAFVDAAMMLVPEGLIARHYMVSRYVPHSWEIAVDYAHGGWIGNSDHSSALALIAAIAKAQEAQ